MKAKEKEKVKVKVKVKVKIFLYLYLYLYLSYNIVQDLLINIAYLLFLSKSILSQNLISLYSHYLPLSQKIEKVWCADYFWLLFKYPAISSIPSIILGPSL